MLALQSFSGLMSSIGNNNIKLLSALSFLVFKRMLLSLIMIHDIVRVIDFSPFSFAPFSVCIC